MSSILFHGPGALDAALNKARTMGQLAGQFGGTGLNVNEAREATAAMLEGSMSFQVQVYVIGPIDEATADASDALLKRVEEFRADVVQPILWAHDIGGVSGTIRSRCLDYWAPRVGPEVDNDAVMGTAFELVNFVREGELGPIPDMVRRHKKELPTLLSALAVVLAQDLDDKNRQLWEALRPVTRWNNPRPAEVVLALLEVVRV